MKFYFKLAASNLKADRRLFVPFVTTTSFLMAVNLIMLNAYASSDVLFKKLGAAAGKSLFMFGTDVIVIISVILAIYANNFLRKQRIRQLGLYNIIGFGKGELGKMMAVEKLLLLLTTLLFGGILGTVLSRISYLALAKMLKVDHNLDFGLSQQAFSIAGIITIGLFVVLLLVDELWLIRKRPIEIVRAQRAGEREPKTKWVTLIVSLIALIAGYYIAVTTTNPLQAMSMFFVAVILVICGTYGLFTAGSVFVLKWLRNRKNYYYKPKHFINVANLNDTTAPGKVARMASANHVIIKSQHTFVGPSSTMALLDGNRLESQANVNGPFSMGNARSVQLMTIESYNRFTRHHARVKSGEVLIYTSKNFPSKTIRIGQKTYRIGKRAGSFPNAQATFIPNLFIAFPEEKQMIDAMQHLRNARYQNAAEAQADITTSQDVMLQGSHANQLKLYEAVVKSRIAESASVQSKAVNYDETMSIMGSFLFLGIIFGVTFILATLLILYYKQLSEGYADARRYTILQRVGLSLREVRATINSQLLMLFYLPLLVAGIHVGFALPFIQRIMILFGLPNWQFFLTVSLITLGIFAIIYVLMYKLTGNVYYRIVSRRQATSRS